MLALRISAEAGPGRSRRWATGRASCARCSRRGLWRPTRRAFAVEGLAGAQMSGSGGWVEAFLEMMAGGARRGQEHADRLRRGPPRRPGRSFQREGPDLAEASAENVEAYFAALGDAGHVAGHRRAPPLRRAPVLPVRAGGGLAQRRPSRRVDAPKKGRPLPKVLSRDGGRRDCIAAAGAARWRPGPAARPAWWSWLYASGLRISELTSLPLRGPGARSGLSDRQGQGRQGAAGPAQRGGPWCGEGLSGGPARSFLPEGRRRQSLAVSVTGQGRAPDPTPLRSAAGRGRRRRRGRSGPGQPPTSCATPSRPICWRAGPTCASFRPCWVTPTSPRPRSTPTWPATGWREVVATKHPLAKKS